MQYNTGTQNLVMIRRSANEDFKKNATVNKIKRNLLIVLVIELALIIILLGGAIILTIERYKNNEFYFRTTMFYSLEKLILEASLCIIYTVLYIILVIKYHHTGVRVLAWFTLVAGIISLVAIFISVMFSLLSASGKLELGIMLLIPIGMFIVVTILQILIIKFSLDFAKAMKAFKMYQITTNPSI